MGVLCVDLPRGFLDFDNLSHLADFEVQIHPQGLSDGQGLRGSAGAAKPLGFSGHDIVPRQQIQRTVKAGFIRLGSLLRVGGGVFNDHFGLGHHSTVGVFYHPRDDSGQALRPNRGS